MYVMFPEPLLVTRKAGLSVESRVRSRPPVSERVKKVVPASWTMKAPVEVRLKLRLLVPVAETLAKPANSRPANWLEAAEKFHLPVMVSLAARQAGPVIQSSFTNDADTVSVTLNILASKEREVM